MTNEARINAVPDQEEPQRPENWEYDIAAECIAKAAACIRKHGGTNMHFKVQFEPFLNAEFDIE